MSDEKDPKPKRIARAGHHYQVIEPEEFEFQALKDNTADPVDPDLPSSAEIAEQLAEMAEDIEQPPLTDDSEDDTIVPDMGEETTGLVTIAQAAKYLGHSASYMRIIYHEGKITGTSVGANWLMLDAESVRAYKNVTVAGRFNPDGYLYKIDLADVELTVQLLALIIENATKAVRIEVRLTEDGVEALGTAGLDVSRAVPPEWGKKKDRSPLAVPEEFQELLKQARQQSS